MTESRRRLAAGALPGRLAAAGALPALLAGLLLAACHPAGGGGTTAATAGAATAGADAAPAADAAPPGATAQQAGATAAAQQAGATATRAAAGATAPALLLRTLTGEAVTLAQLAAGRVVLLSLWATWCEPCLQEFPALQRFAAQAPEREVLAVAVSVGEPRAQVAAFVSQSRLTYRHLVDEDFRFSDALGQRRVPATLVLDRGGRVAYSGGAFDEAALAALRALLPAR